jgi:hypothetical protein
MPPAVGMINESVTAMRPDLRGMAGFTVRVPKSFDIDTAEGPHATRTVGGWVRCLALHPSGLGPILAFPREA